MSIPGGEQGQVKQQPQKNSHLTLSFLPVENVGGGLVYKGKWLYEGSGGVGRGWDVIIYLSFDFVAMFVSIHGYADRIGRAAAPVLVYREPS